MPASDAFPPRGVLLDLDGVLLDSRLAIATSMNHALATQGLSTQPMGALLPWIGPPLLEFFKAVAGPGLAMACLEAYRERYRVASLDETTLVPGIVDAVARLAARVPVAVATSKPRAFALPLCEHLGLAPHLQVVVGPDLADPEEVKTVTVARALAELGVPDAPIVGDREHDAIAAAANGIRCVGVLWGIGGEAELRAAGADPILREPSELPAALGFQ
jgi:phosphoglycolate phosphatase